MLNDTRQQWTPTISASVTPGDLSVVYAAQNGWFAQSGSIARLEVFVQFTPTYTTASGNLVILGAPFPNIPGVNWTGSLRQLFPGFTWPAGASMLMPITQNIGGSLNQLGISIASFGTGANLPGLAITAFPSGSSASIGLGLQAIIPN